MAADMIDRLFPNLDEVLTVHQSYSLAMKHKTQRGFPVGPVGDLLEGMFQGSAGERLKVNLFRFFGRIPYTVHGAQITLSLYFHFCFFSSKATL